MCWNIACLPEDIWEDSITKMLDELKIKDKEFARHTRMLVAKKIMFYDEYKYFISQYHISMKGGTPYLSVASAKLD